jgi:hypothetical protein
MHISIVDNHKNIVVLHIIIIVELNTIVINYVNTVTNCKHIVALTIMINRLS